MSRICTQCGTEISDDLAAFCDRCGKPLEPRGRKEARVCRQCGRLQPDELSRFCDRCGTPLTFPDPIAPRVPAATKRMTCPVCGFSNTGDFLFFCRKCGSTLAGGAGAPAIPHREPRVTCPACGFPNTGENLLFCRKCGSSLTVTGRMTSELRRTGTEPQRRLEEGRSRIIPDLKGNLPLVPPDKPSGPAHVDLPAGVPGTLREERRKSTQIKSSVSLRKLAVISAAIILLLLGIAFLTGNLPGMGGTGLGNSGVSDNKSPAMTTAIAKSDGSSPRSVTTIKTAVTGNSGGSSAGSVTSTKTAVTANSGGLSAGTTIANRGTAVVTDLPPWLSEPSS